MDANFTETLEEFMGSALVTWVGVSNQILSFKAVKQA